MNLIESLKFLLPWKVIKYGGSVGAMILLTTNGMDLPKYNILKDPSFPHFCTSCLYHIGISSWNICLLWLICLSRPVSVPPRFHYSDCWGCFHIWYGRYLINIDVLKILTLLLYSLFHMNFIDTLPRFIKNHHRILIAICKFTDGFKSISTFTALGISACFLFSGPCPSVKGDQIMRVWIFLTCCLCIS